MSAPATDTRKSQTNALKVGDDIFKGDVLQTGAGGALGITFDDESTFKLSANAPATCKPTINEPPEDADTQQLSDAFSSALGQNAQQPGGSGPMSDGGSVSIGSSKSVAIECAKS